MMIVLIALWLVSNYNKCWIYGLTVSPVEWVKTSQHLNGRPRTCCGLSTSGRDVYSLRHRKNGPVEIVDLSIENGDFP